MNPTWLGNLRGALSTYFEARQAIIHAFVTAVVSTVAFEAYSELSSGKPDFSWEDLKKAAVVAAFAWLAAYFKSPGGAPPVKN